MIKQNKWTFWVATVSLIFTIGLGWYSMYLLNPPAAVSKNAPATEFSAERAIEHAFFFSAETHPAGSAANEITATYLLNTLETMGLETEFMSKSALYGNRLQLQQAVIGKIPGTNSSGAIVFSAHYDSVPYGPGASDDGTGCITMLETARAFMNRPPLENDLVFAFFDVEEIDGWGARGFCSEPITDTIGIATNLDVRGTKGPALVYETSSNNGALIEELMKAKVHGVLPVANSMMFAVYESSPFGSDFTKFRHAGKKGYNIAYIDNFCWYHTVNDSPEHIHGPSIQHMGAYTMGLAEHFGNVDFNTMALERENAIYFNTLGYHMVQYPHSWGLPLALLAALLFFVVLGFGFYYKRLGFKGYVAALLLIPGVTIIAIVVVLAMLILVFGFDNMMRLYTVKFTYVPGPKALYYSNLSCYAFAAMTIALVGFTLSWASRRIRLVNLYAAALTWLVPFLAGIVLFFLGGSYLLTWPLLFGSLGLAIVCAGSKEAETHPLWAGLAVLFSIPALCLLPPIWKMLMWMLMILAAPGIALLTVVFLLNLVPLLALVGRLRTSRSLYPALAIIALLMLGTGIMLSAPSRSCPLMDSVAYYLDVDSEEAWWLSEDPEVDEWTVQFFPDGTRTTVDDLWRGRRGDHFLRAEAPIDEALQGIQYEILHDEMAEGKRAVHLRLFTGDRPFDVALKQEGGAPIQGVTVDGHELKDSEENFHMTLQMIPTQGYDMHFETEGGEALRFEAFSTIYGFPELDGIKPRPEYIVPEPNTMRDGISIRSQHMYVKNHFEIPAFVPEEIPAAAAAVEDAVEDEEAAAPEEAVEDEGAAAPDESLEISVVSDTAPSV
ncbi:MAG: M28 family peptidase [Candidatus Hydrogenedentales bacterium]